MADTIQVTPQMLRSTANDIQANMEQAMGIAKGYLANQENVMNPATWSGTRLRFRRGLARRPAPHDLRRHRQQNKCAARVFRGPRRARVFDAQAQMLSGLQGLIETVGQHGTTTGHVLDNAIGTDQAIAGLF